MQPVVLPLAVDRQAVDRHARRVQRGCQLAHVRWPPLQLGGAAADFPSGEGRPETRRDRGERVEWKVEQPLKAEPGPFQERSRAGCGPRSRREDGGLPRQGRVRLRPEDGQIDEAREDNGVAQLSFRDIVETQPRRLQYGRAPDRLISGPFPY